VRNINKKMKVKRNNKQLNRKIIKIIRSEVVLMRRSNPKLKMILKNNKNS
jgi:hypothetical protein